MVVFIPHICVRRPLNMFLMGKSALLFGVETTGPGKERVVRTKTEKNK